MGGLKVLPAHWERMKAADARRAEREKHAADWEALMRRIDLRKREDELYVQIIRDTREPMVSWWRQKFMGSA